MPRHANSVPVGALRMRQEGYVAVCLNSLRVDSVADFDIYIQLGPDEPFTLYCERNLPFSEDVRQRLVDNNVDQIFINAAQRGEYARYVESHLAEIMEDPTISPLDKSEILYTSAHGVIENLLTTLNVEEGLPRIKEIVRHTVSSLFRDETLLAHFLKVISLDYTVYTHSVNVAVYSIALAQRMGNADPASLREMANGAMLHDIGKARIDPAILLSKSRLTPKQRDAIRRHPLYGFDLLREADSLGEIALDIVRHHHEKLRGGGYPDNIRGNLISPFVRMVTIADVFDAITTRRPFKAASGSFQALNVMRVEMGADLDARLFRAFVSMMGPQGPASGRHGAV